MSQSDNVVISGGGLAGACLARLLADKGENVTVYELRPDMRRKDIPAGRSINLALSARGQQALRAAGVEDEILKISIPMYKRVMHAKDGTITEQSYSKDGKSHINSISRGDLNKILMTRAEEAGAKFVFETKAELLSYKKCELRLSKRNEPSAEPSVIAADAVIGADGAYSAVRKSLMRMDRFDYSQSYLQHGYKELEIPAAEDGGFRLEPHNALHIWPRGTYMMIALPNMDHSYTVTLFMQYESTKDNKYSFSSLKTHEEVMNFFKDQFTDIIPLIPNLLEQWDENPAPSLVTVRCSPWKSTEANIAVLGDAAHAIVPFFGQGMNAALEDCYELVQCLEAHQAAAGGGGDAQKKFNWSEALEDFQERRITNANAIADMALENFIEMRDKTADEDFLFKKKIDHLLGNEFPEQYLSRYERVSFSTIPYREAYNAGLANDKILSALGDDLIKQNKRDVKLVDMEKAKALVNEHFPLKK